MSPATAPVASVLVVDDTIDNLRLLSDLLGQQGYDVRAVTNGRQALQAVAHDPPDLILLDITMPEMDGFEVCRRLREVEGSRDVPVIFLTAVTDTADKVRAFDTGGVDYVTKPFHIEEVIARVRTHVALRRARAELAGSYRRLSDTERLRDDLVHMIVHDMRSPLTVLQISLNLLNRRAAGLSDDTSRDCLQQAVASVRVLDRMTNELLDVSRLEEGKMPITPAVWDLARMAHDVCTTLGTIDLDRAIDVDSADTVQVTCDGGLIRRVLENLVSNGIRHTPAGSRIGISIASRNQHVRVAVHDEGPGVPPEHRSRIFEKFATVEARQERTDHSTGLGLAFCKLAVEAQGGAIGMEPRVPAGSTFWFELPA